MKTLVKIAWRNVWRNPKRSLVMILAVTVGLWGGIFAASLSFGLIAQRFELTIVQHVSHIQIHHPEFLKDYNLRYSIPEWDELERYISEHESILAYSPRTRLNGMLASANLTKGINIIGVDPELEAATTGINHNTVEGSYLNQDSRHPILVGKKLAEKNKLQEGSRVVLTFQGYDGDLIAGTFRVAGIFQTSNTAYDEGNVYVLHTDLANFLDHPDCLNEVAIMAYDIEQVEQVASSTQQIFPGLSVRSWTDISPELSYMQEMAGTMLMFILVIILLALAFGLVNTMLMSVYERIKEIGVLMAIGMNKKRLFSMITIETVFLTFLGAFAGIITGSLTIRLLQNTGLNLGAVGGDTLNEWGFPSMVYPQLEPSFFGMLVILVVITSMFTSIFPSMKALRLHPAEAIRKE
jgi:putative ABC transport system permease protein